METKELQIKMAELGIRSKRLRERQAEMLKEHADLILHLEELERGLTKIHGDIRITEDKMEALEAELEETPHAMMVFFKENWNERKMMLVLARNEDHAEAILRTEFSMIYDRPRIRLASAEEEKNYTANQVYAEEDEKVRY